MELDAWVTASLGGGSKGLGVPPLGDPPYSGADGAAWRSYTSLA